MAAKRDPKIDHDTVRLRGWIDLAVGLVLFAIGAITKAATYSDVTHTTTIQLATDVALLAGGLTAARGIWRLVRAPLTGAVPIKLEVRGLGYKSFVAWRYLLVANRKVRPLTTQLLSAGLAVLIAVALVRTTRLDPDLPALRNPLWVLELISFGFIFVVVFAGVLPTSKPALVVGVLGLAVFVLAFLGLKLVGMSRLPFVHLDPDQVIAVKTALTIAAGIGAGLALLAMFFGCIRAYFTFFTTVPIGGVWIGTAALVMVLAVMSGFESDLREKILGSNAHLQITREDGDFVEWHDVKAQIDRMPGVVASTPFAVSEVVVAANNTGMNVIIKGIDPNTVGKVTDLVSDLEDHASMKRLEPMVGDAPDLRVPQRPRTGSGAGAGGATIDPPPDDMPTPGEPIDFSGASLDAGDAGSGSEAGSGAQLEGSEPFGGEARRLQEPEKLFSNDLENAPDDKGIDQVIDRLDGQPPRAAGAGAPRHHAVIDPPPPDLVTPEEPPTDYSQPDYLQDVVVKAVDSPFDTPSLSRRTQSLPGILVGRELVKQTHLYTGEEVRIVSPLSDPSNPDATGTPIPFNRDYRVAGIFYTGMYEYDLKYVYVTLDSLQEFLDRGDAVDGIEVRVNNPDDTDAFVSKFQATFGSQYRVQDWKELNRSLFSALKLEKIAMFLVLGIVILVASFSIVGNLIMVVVEKAREIALLKTLGASDVGVMQLFAIQGLMIGLIGTALGVGTGLLGCWAGKRFGIPVSPDVYYIDRLPIHVDPMSVLAAASAGILISIAATLYPAVVAARVRPAAGMRH
jgi:lipoprotein-releasing system permease protein